MMIINKEGNSGIDYRSGTDCSELDYSAIQDSYKKDPKLNTAFLAVYAVGCVLLSVGNFLGNDVTGGILNVFDVILPVTILATLIVAKKTI